MVVEPEISPKVAVIWQYPMDNALACPLESSPLLIDTTVLLDAVHVTTSVKFSSAPSANTPIASNWSREPGWIASGLYGDILIAFSPNGPSSNLEIPSVRSAPLLSDGAPTPQPFPQDVSIRVRLTRPYVNTFMNLWLFMMLAVRLIIGCIVNKRLGILKGHPSAAQLSCSSKTRYFPSPSHDGFSFIGV